MGLFSNLFGDSGKDLDNALSKMKNLADNFVDEDEARLRQNKTTAPSGSESLGNNPRPVSVTPVVEEGPSGDSSHCTSCKNGFLFQEDKGNCLTECLKEGYYRENNKCKNCHEDCLTCNQGYSSDSSHCTSCKDDKLLLQEDKGNCLNECLKEGYYQDNNYCKNCHSNCLTCNQGPSSDS